MQLAVVIAALARNRPSLAIGNIIGSAISNILGAFSLGLLFHGQETQIQFDRSSRIYSLVLLLLTTFVTPATYFSVETVWSVCGSILIAFFAIYIASVGWAISRGTLTAPEDSDDSSDDDSSNEDGAGDESDSDDSTTGLIAEWAHNRANRSEGRPYGAIESNQSSRRTSQGGSTKMTRAAARDRRPHRTLSYHIFHLFLGFVAICLAGYVLSHAATSITDELGMSDVLFGVVILAIATTLPEKFIAVMSGRRGHAGILVANTAGSNIFLLALCSGIVMLDTNGNFERGNVNIPELGVLWGSTLAFTATIWLNGRLSRFIGIGMLIAYVAFVVLEFVVIY